MISLVIFYNFWFWWTVCAVILLLINFIGSDSDRIKEIKHKKIYTIKGTKSRFVNQVIEWCMNNMDYPTGHKYYPEVKICYYTTKNRRFGDYTSNSRLIRIFINNHCSVAELINTVIHEYTHYLQMPTQQDQDAYNKFLKQKGYFDNPYEIEARLTADKYTAICLKEMIRIGAISRNP